jgi:hypothetical protein
MTAATGLYRRIRASTERARDRIGLDQSDETRQSRPGIPAWRTARGNTECDRRCRSPMMAPRSRARSWSVAIRNGGDGLGPDGYLRCTYRVPRIDLKPASRPVDPPAASVSRRSEAASAVWHPHAARSASRSLEQGAGHAALVLVSDFRSNPSDAPIIRHVDQGHSAARMGRERIRTRPRAIVTNAPVFRSSATAGRFAASRAACWSGVR